MKPKSLASIFEASYDTARVLTQPSEVTKEMALNAISAIDWSGVMRALGTIAAQKISEDLESLALKPSDYADPELLPKMIADKLSKELKALPMPFALALLEQLRLRG